MRIINTLRRMQVGLESAELTVDPSTLLVADAPPPVETAEALIELNTSHGEAEQVAEDIQTVFSAQDQLGQIATGLEAFANGRGISEMEYRMTQHAVRGAVRGLGFSTTRVSVEAFDTSSNRVTTANVALEDVKSKLKAAGEWVKEMVSAFIEMVKQYAAKLFTAAGQLKTKATALKARAEKTDGRQNGKITLTAKAAGDLSLGKSFVGDLVGASGRLVALVEAEVEKLVPAQTAAIERVKAALKEDGVIADSLGPIIDAYQALPGTNWHQEGDLLVTDELVGGYAYSLNPESGAVSLTRTFDVLEEDTEVPALDDAKVKTVCDNVIALADVLAKAKDELENRMKEAARVQSLPGGMMSDSAKDTEEYAAQVRKAMKTQLALLKGTLQQLTRYSAHTATAMLSACEKSLDAYADVGEQKALPA